MIAQTSSASTVEEAAAEIFARRLNGPWDSSDEVALEERIKCDVVFAECFADVEASWAMLGRCAETPEMMRDREEALSAVRRANGRRWLMAPASTAKRWAAAAAVVGIAIASGVAWQLSPYAYVPGQYRTGIGEQRMIELDDHSRIALDATTRIQVSYSKDARIVELAQGQAQFSVAHDPARPFKVIAGGHTIVAVGTVFTVDFDNQSVHVAMIEGRVAVLSPRDAAKHSIELSTGEELKVERDGRPTIIPKGDLEAATAWREGKVIFRAEPLSEAIRRLNRYSRVQIEINDATLANHLISGVFEAGDSLGFVSAIEQYLPVVADAADPNKIVLRPR
jgi:transmembrane sensor